MHYSKTQLRTLTWGHFLKEMQEIGSDENKAKDFFRAYVEIVREDVPGLTVTSAADRAAGNLRYLVGYAPGTVDNAMWSQVYLSVN